MPRKLSPDERAIYEALLRTAQGKETIAANLNRLIRQRAAEDGTGFSACIVDHLLPTVAGDRDATIRAHRSDGHRRGRAH